MTVAVDNIRAVVDEILPGVIADRRHLHQYPELAFQEFETAQFVANRLEHLGVEDVRTGLAITGVTGLIRGTAEATGPAKTLMLRADMDALPIHELTGVDYASLADGKMHACGHDSHVAMLLGTTRVLMENRSHFYGTIKVLFQPAEEGGGGARAMMNAGALLDPPVDASMGLHIWQGADVGIVEVRDGVSMVGADGFTIAIQGKGGHGAYPQRSIDPIVIGAEIVTALQSLVSRENDPVVPAVVSIGAFLAGEAANVIPDRSVLRGTTRTVSREQRDKLEDRIRSLVGEIAATNGAEAEVDLKFGVGPLVNDQAIAAIVRSAAIDVAGDQNVIDGGLKSVSEDYGDFLNDVPGCFFFVGSRNAERGLVYGHHHPQFDMDENAMAIGVATMSLAAMRYLNS